jgi:hypothetical protein
MDTITQDITSEPTQELQLVTEPNAAAVSPGEITAIARRLGKEYKDRLDYYTSEKQRKEYPHRTTEEHFALARQPDTKEYAEREMQTPPDAISWVSMESIMSYNPEMFWRKWEEVKEQAAHELTIGHTAAMACQPEDSPWNRAQYCAIRNELCRDWNPRNGIEQLLIDQMTQAYSQLMYWQKIMMTWMNLDSKAFREDWDARTPRLSTFDAVNRASDMVDRFNRMFLRTLRALQNMRRVPVIVQNAGQVNLAQQQVNISER